LISEEFFDIGIDLGYKKGRRWEEG